MSRRLVYTCQRSGAIENFGMSVSGALAVIRSNRLNDAFHPLLKLKLGHFHAVIQTVYCGGGKEVTL